MSANFGLVEAIRSMVPTEAFYSDGLCGETFDHTEEYTYESEDLIQWVCRNCGAEGEYDPRD